MRVHCRSGCGRRTERAAGKCRRCDAEAREKRQAAKRAREEAEIALPPGRWVLDPTTRIQRFITEETAA